MSFKNKYLLSKKAKVILCWFLPVQFFIYKCISFFPEVVEQVYSNGIYIPISKTIRLLFGWISIPVGQLLIISFIVYIIFSFIKIITSKQYSLPYFKEYALTFLAFLSVIYFLFITMWGFNYSRQDLNSILKIEKSTITLKELEKTCLIIIDSTNSIRNKISTNSTTPSNFEINWSNFTQECDDGFNNLSNSNFNYSTVSVKRVIGSKTMSYLGLGGIYFPFTGEANVNGDLPTYSLPFTTCHEMAHQIGFAKEDEANYVSFLVGSKHTNIQFRYSAYLAMLKYCMGELYFQNELKFEKIRSNYSKGVLTDLIHNKEYWDSFRSPLQDYSSDINNLFLKVNNQNEGIESYNNVVNLLIDDYKKKGVL